MAFFFKWWQFFGIISMQFYKISKARNGIILSVGVFVLVFTSVWYFNLRSEYLVAEASR